MKTSLVILVILPVIVSRGNAGVALQSDELLVELSAALPGPEFYLHKPSGSVFAGVVHYQEHNCSFPLLNNTGLLGALVDEYHLASGLSVGDAMNQCGQACQSPANNSWCQGWSLLLATSDREVPGCRLFSSVTGCLQDDYQNCGVVKDAFDIRVVGVSGDFHSYNVTAVEYTEVNLTTASWKIVGSGGASSAQLTATGSIGVQRDYMEWILVSIAATDDSGAEMVVRQLDLGYFMAGLNSSGGYFYSQSSKKWCPPGTPCGEWSESIQLGNIGDISRRNNIHLQSSSTSTKSAMKNTDVREKWNPPYLPWAYVALLAGRSNSVGAWNSQEAAGISAWSSSATIPISRTTRPSSFVFGPARLDVNLRCGSLLPYRFRVGVFGDMNKNNRMDANDAVVWARRQFPNADISLRTSLLWKFDNDMTSYKSSVNTPRTTFNETLLVIQAMAAIADGMPQIVWLVGWQGTGHDTLYPSYDIVNPRLGTVEDLKQLASAAFTLFNATVSYHINTDEAYWNYTLPGMDGQHNPDCVLENLDMMPSNGSGVQSQDPWPWSTGDIFTDPVQGPPYHISKTKDYASGCRWKRYQAMLETIPVTRNIHMDAWRDINDSFEEDDEKGYGFIAENEEWSCGCANDAKFFWENNGISVGCEGRNGMLSDPVHAQHFYWHGGFDFCYWNKLVEGSYMGIDNDVGPGMDLDFNGWADIIYTKVRLYQLQMTDEMLSQDPLRFAGGGNDTHWPYGGPKNQDFIVISNQKGGYFLPAVVSPPASLFPVGKPPFAERTNLATLDQCRIYAYQQGGSTDGTVQQWILPFQWLNNSITSFAITSQGRVPGPNVDIDSSSRTLTLKVIPFQPVLLQACAD